MSLLVDINSRLKRPRLFRAAQKRSAIFAEAAGQSRALSSRHDAMSGSALVDYINIIRHSELQKFAH
jgi:hypothetical protein